MLAARTSPRTRIVTCARSGRGGARPVRRSCRRRRRRRPRRPTPAPPTSTRRSRRRRPRAPSSPGASSRRYSTPSARTTARGRDSARRRPRTTVRARRGSSADARWVDRNARPEQPRLLIRRAAPARRRRGRGESRGSCGSASSSRPAPDAPASSTVVRSPSEAAVDGGAQAGGPGADDHEVGVAAPRARSETRVPVRAQRAWDRPA